MNIKTAEEIEDFFAIVDECKGHVEFRTQWGDVFNLQSTLSRFIVPAAMLSENGQYLELFCESKEDEQKFFKFFNDHPTTM